MSKKEKNIRQTTKDQEKPRIVKRKEREKNAVSTPFVRLSELPFILIILAYVFIVTFTPNWMALDTNASKFLSLSVLNFLSFLALFFFRTKNLLSKNNLIEFFNGIIFKIYTLFLITILLSFVKAINLQESVLQFFKHFTIFNAVYILTVILSKDIKYIKFLITIITFLLIFDTLTVFYYIDQFIKGLIPDILSIKSVYSNKNILASAVFVKIPFALYLFLFEKKWMKIIGFIGVFLGFIATFFMATRGFFVGLFIVAVVFTLYNLYKYFAQKSFKPIKDLLSILGALVLAIGIYTFVQSNLFPKMGRQTEGIGAQIASIQGDASTSVRIESWLWSLDLIKRNPIFGVGAGNWKINILEYENKTKTGYIYLFKAHNDFIETTAETGLLGGVLFLSIFALVFLYFLKLLVKREFDKQSFSLFFLAFFGLFFYSFDAMFNFPADRPEIQLFFSISLAIAITARTLDSRMSQIHKPEIKKASRIFSTDSLIVRRLFFGLVLFTSGFAILVFLLNFKSSQLQRVVYQEILAQRLTEKADRFLQEFPFFPNISIWGESISAIKARYLLEEKRYQEVIDILRNDLTNPYDGRREHFMSVAFNMMNLPDSVTKYAEKVLAVKPYYFRNVSILSEKFEEKDQLDDAEKCLTNFLSFIKGDQQAWLYTSIFLEKHGKISKAYELMDSARIHLPEDSLILQQHRYLNHKLNIEPFFHLYVQATEFYNKGEFNKALPLLDEFIRETPYDINVVKMRIYVLYNVSLYERCIDEITEMIKTGEIDMGLTNLRGVCYHAQGKLDLACGDFETAMKAGLESGTTNYNLFCSHLKQN